MDLKDGALGLHPALSAFTDQNAVLPDGASNRNNWLALAAGQRVAR